MSLVCRGLGGGEFTFDLPLSNHARAQIDRGEMRVVKATGDDRRPDPAAKKETWVIYMERVHGIDPRDAEAESKQSIMEWVEELEDGWEQ